MVVMVLVLLYNLFYQGFKKVRKKRKQRRNGMEKQQTKRNEQTSGIQARISDAFIRVMILLCIGSVVGIIAIFVMSSQYESAMENYGFSQGGYRNGHVIIRGDTKCTAGSYWI